jgi:hypothetical protein
MQAKAGTRAVAAEVAHATAKSTRPPLDSMSDSTTAVHVRPTADDDDEEEPQTKTHSPREPRESREAPPLDDDEPTRMGPTPPMAAKAPIPAAGARPPPVLISPPTEPTLTQTNQPALRYPRDAETQPRGVEAVGKDPLAEAPSFPAAMRPPAPSASGEIEISSMQPVPTGPAIPKRAGPPFEPPPEPKNGAMARDRLQAPSSNDKPLAPHPRDVLDALALAGVFEPPTERSAAAAWARPDAGPKRKGAGIIIGGIVTFLAASVGVFFFYKHKRAEEHMQAEALCATVEAQVASSKPGVLDDAEKELTQAFQLESRSPRTALDWAHERAMVGLIKSGADVAFEDAMARAKEVGIPEEKYAFAHVASFLFQGDTAGAAAVLPRWDGPAGIDPWYDVVAGATLERAGDARAGDRYAAAAKLDPNLLVAQFLQARAAAIAGDAAGAMKLAQNLRKSLPDRAEPLALVALAWGRDVNRENIPAPPELDELAKRIEELPVPLRFVPHAVAALRAFDKHAWDDAAAEVQKGLLTADVPGAAVWLGTIALPLGNEALARKGALQALQFSAVYEPARALAARVALLGDRLDEALKATEDLDASSPDVAVVRAAAAYERVDADGVTRALEALPPESRKLPALSALDMAGDALSGALQLDSNRLVTMAADDPPWSDVIAMDAALDAGDLASADQIATGWGKDSADRPLRALRLARLARYENRLDQADALSQTALEHGTVTPRVLWERVFVLVAKNRGNEVGSLLAHYPLVLGPLATWLSAYGTASNGNTEGAKGRTASTDPPPSAAPLAARVIAAAAFGAMKDKRRGADYVKDVLSTGSQHPDLVAAALALGFHRVDHGKKKPTYEQ